ncbi:hypothetical protein EYC80_009010 [Monilinia laxa]|uniref:Uncharacterized protein n=1 Tax=Monilinia laxa TaxID=61186 RepID=A0A5N6K290_MONLA|nr:hypothetical protein EYC80_009010 [Monilinia laxa]
MRAILKEKGPSTRYITVHTTTIYPIYLLPPQPTPDLNHTSTTHHSHHQKTHYNHFFCSLPTVAAVDLICRVICQNISYLLDLGTFNNLHLQSLPLPTPFPILFEFKEESTTPSFIYWSTETLPLPLPPSLSQGIGSAKDSTAEGCNDGKRLEVYLLLHQELQVPSKKGPPGFCSLEKPMHKPS